MSDTKGIRESRSAARLTAVQGLYQMSITGVAPATVIGEFAEHRFGREGEGGTPASLDRPFFEDIVRGVDERGAEIDDLVNRALARERDIGRLEKILSAILRAGVYELLARVDVPARVIVSEYVDVAHAFFAGAQPGLVNGVLDRLARDVRPGEFQDVQQKAT